MCIFRYITNTVKKYDIQELLDEYAHKKKTLDRGEIEHAFFRCEILENGQRNGDFYPYEVIY